MKTTRSAMLFLQVLQFTDMKKRDGFWCVKTLTKNAAFFCRLFFDVLPFTTLAVSVNSKTSKKSMQKNAALFGVSKGLDTPKNAASFLHAFL